MQAGAAPKELQGLATARGPLRFRWLEVDIRSN